MSEADQPLGRVLGEFRDYNQMLAGLRARITELQLAGETLDEVSGLPKGYASKLTSARPTRRIGAVSLGPILGVLGIKCLFVEDEDALRRVADRLTRRNSNLVRGGTTVIELSHRFMRKIQAKGRKARFAKMTAEQRSELARELNRIRWKKPRVTEIKRKARAA
jgi:hypothetical protein